MTDDAGATVGAWTELVRRARLGHELTAVALAFASYANADGTGIHCGTARLALDCEVGYSTARRYLARLRRYGLVECTARVRKRGLSDEYRLVIDSVLLDYVDLPDPERYRKMAGDLRQRNQRKHKRKSTAHPDEPYNEKYGSHAGACTAHPGEHPPSLTHLPAIDLPSSEHLEEKPVQDRDARASDTTPINEHHDRRAYDHDTEYERASARLARLPDLGSAHMTRVRETLGDGATMRALVIEAARLASEGNAA